jgi:quinol monooxygenase YgiN
VNTRAGERHGPSLTITGMAFGVVSLHYPKPEHRDELVRRLAAAADVMAATEGCVDVAYWEERETRALVSTGTFTSEDAWNRAVQAVLAAKVDFAYDQREARPRDVYFLVQPC